MEAGADHDVGVIKSVEQSIEIRRIMLPISIHLHQSVESLSLGEEKGRPHGSTDAHIEGQGHHQSARLAGQLRCRIRGSIVDHQDARLRTMFAYLGDHLLD